MKVALLTTQSRVAPVFEVASTWLMINATPSECSICSSHHFTTQNEIEMVNELLTKDIELLICGAIPYYLEKLLINQGCEVFGFIAGEVDQVIKALDLNLLDNPEFKMPGCQKRKKRGNDSLCRRVAKQ